MSFLGKLGKIGMMAAPFAAMAIPGVGPALGGVMKAAGSAGKIGQIAGIAGKVAPMLGKMSAAQSAGKQRDAQNSIAEDRNAMDRYRMEQGARTNARQQGVRASMVANASPVKFNVGPDGKRSVSGGYANPSLINPDARSIGSNLSHQYAMDTMKPNMGVPQATALPQSGFMDKLLGGGAIASSLLGAFSKRPVTGATDSTDPRRMGQMGPFPVDSETDDTEYS